MTTIACSTKGKGANLSARPPFPTAVILNTVGMNSPRSPQKPIPEVDPLPARATEQL